MDGEDDDDIVMLPEGSRRVYGEIAAAAVEGAAMQASVDLQGATAEHMELTSESAATRERQEALLRDFEARRRARTLAVPTDDAAVRVLLRARGEPVTLFGEREMERRDRLRALLAAESEGVAGPADSVVQAQELLVEAPPVAELFYTEGGDALHDARLRIAHASLCAASARLAEAKDRQQRGLPPTAQASGEELTHVVAALITESSQFGDDRPLSDLAVSPDGAFLLTGSWSGGVAVWRNLTRGCDRSLFVRAHEERVSGVAWHPDVDAGDTLSRRVAFATAACDKSARLWSADGTLLHTLLGHADRLGRCRWHPSGEFLATAGYDATWRLWDAATGAQLLVQEGHARAVYAVAFQPDGSLAISGGLDGHARVWDLRTGHSVYLLKGHCQGITACDWSPDGYTCATGSADHATRVWDVRQAGRCVAVLPAHGGTITSVRFEPTAGGALLTASHDATCKLWGAPNWTLLRALRTGEARVMAADLAPGAVLMATASYDRTVKVWVAPATFPRGDADMADE